LTRRNNINKGCCERSPSTVRSDLCAHINEHIPNRAHHPDDTHNINRHTNQVNVVIENGNEGGQVININNSDICVEHNPGIRPPGHQTQSHGEHLVLNSNSSHTNIIHEYIETLTDCDTHIHNSNTIHVGSSVPHTNTTAPKGLRRVSDDGSGAQANLDKL
jgi:hypothetical protein